ncbi:hypothetical protein ACFQ4L_10830 [Lapidilactobacillus mulanensis]|uniref:Uncharacterized protein n=1 Tax=Lapidilactobacillus mulanensis TaxID=2485999 RepID=A0ABW4DR90_9LACO|nr:hypothetical protein [Lapidilactobacillus mulanensis]
MLINDKQVISIQIKKIINTKNIECLSEDGEVVNLHLTAIEKNDPLFWWSLVKIYTAQLWIPIVKQTRTLLETDWLQDPLPISD